MPNKQHMLAKMALSKLVIKTLDRTNLFFNKFMYRINVTGVPSVHRINKCTNIQDYIDHIDKLYADWEQSKERYPHGWYRTPQSSTELDLTRIENLIGLMQKYNDKSLITYRCENSTVSVYTSDLALAKEFADTLSVGLLTQVNPMPTGVMLFKRSPPAKYRAYMTNNKVPPDFKENFVAYLERTPDVKPSSLFRNYFVRRYTFLWEKYYVDYDDEKNLMMMMLMFPGMIGKKFKLEKK
jgi:hypothetical protein